MKHFLIKIFICLTLLLQIHCTTTTVNELYSGKSGEDIRSLCDKMFEDSGIKNVQKLEAKLKYQECLQKNFMNPIHPFKADKTLFMNYSAIMGIAIGLLFSEYIN